MTARAAVKVRWQRGGVIGPWQPADQAGQAATELLDRVQACGDGTGFVTFVGFDGRVAHIRGRDVVTIEVVPDLPARIPPAATTGAERPATSGTVAAITVNYPTHGVGAPVSDATQFLRQQAARRPSINGAGR